MWVSSTISACFLGPITAPIAPLKTVSRVPAYGLPNGDTDNVFGAHLNVRRVSDLDDSFVTAVGGLYERVVHGSNAERAWAIRVQTIYIAVKADTEGFQGSGGVGTANPQRKQQWGRHGPGATIGSLHPGEP